MYEEDTIDAKGVLVYKSKDEDIPLIATGLDLQVPKPEVNDNYVKSSVMLSRWNTYDR